MADNDTPNIIGKKTELQDPKTGKFVKGNPGGGRPVGSISIVEAIKRKLVEVPDGQTKTYLELAVIRYFKKAIQDGDSKILKDLIDRVDGKALQKVEASIENRLPDAIEELNNNANIAGRVKKIIDGQGLEANSSLQDKE